MTPRVGAGELKEMLRDGRELALLDVREEGPFAAGHLLFATPLPLSRLEPRIRALMPRHGARTVLVDGADDGPAALAAERLAGFGYTDVAVLEGGTEGWRAAGHQVFSGLNVPSKAFGEFVEHTYHTPSVSPEELQALLAGKRKLVILDSRPMDEFSVMNIPGGVNVPGAELVYRVHDLAPEPDTLVVVNCAGRTRSIIGAQSLINAGLPNPVVALRNGTMGWHLAGLELERGKRLAAPAPSPAGLERAQAAAQRVAQRFGVRSIDEATLAAWQAEAGQRTLYVLDVRGPEEFEAGHRPGARNAPGGQLVQATDSYMATRNARVVLLDNAGVRATLTASWLIQMGWSDVYVLSGDGAGVAQERGAAPVEVPGLDAIRVKELSPEWVAERVTTGQATVLDLARSPEYRRGHIPGAWFAIRADLPAALERAGRPGYVVLTSPDGVLARLAAPEVLAAGVRTVQVLRGGTNAWRAARQPLEEGTERMASEPVDVFPKPYERDGGVDQAMRDYLTWEVALVEQLSREGDVSFRAFA